MMVWLWCLGLALGSEASVWSERWLTVAKIVERHSEFVSGDVLKRPEGTWQLLYGTIRSESAPAGFVRDCLWVKIPKKGDGELKLTVQGAEEACGMQWEKEELLHLKKLKAIQFALDGSRAQLWLTDETGRVLNWKASSLNIAQEAEKKLYGNSAPVRVTPGVFFFAPNATVTQERGKDLVGELADSYPARPCTLEGDCRLCRYGVYRVGEAYYCGIDRCGEKNQPACLRGTRWQRTRTTFSCRTDDSHIFCAPGLKVECEGEQALCR
jgi:hypothetical protein